jgi:hypothetical protein
MIGNRILELNLIDVTCPLTGAKSKLPVVPGDVYVTQECDGHYTVCENKVSASVCGGTHKSIAHLLAIKLEAATGLFVVFADDKEFATLDPSNDGEAMTDYKLDSDKIRQWPVWYGVGTQLVNGKQVAWEGPFKPPLPAPAVAASVQNPWLVGNLTITAAKPSIYSSIGNLGFQDSLDNATGSVMEGP